MDKKLYLLQKIENCRMEMIELTGEQAYTSDAVVDASKRLDNLLNELVQIELVVN
ncbi:aspartyl-phosphate phosphatase Spo0E family protein [Aquibacillus koreensis]|uniref:Aspartyl-phosphate phosphatase Spo0E family protein n=1 Tax=Aquibacillus koreensis TaxID=279446 RepID=A0A9X3WNC6_9BACI|nr:aspartyl-phosphate phosphatase Spo0E family protein [Aquibacillus koreensis]MCT2536100.1 aspartyl-phosphate phosphatase Spo0E family protein [Aquibacillus koreensis]MDC3422025.1 aspartyl-phosphate phosphatase Spo0E family protein [Aquibacillus koreensis]